MAEDSRPRPLAEGHFSKTPFAHILVYLHNRSLSGTLEVRATHDVASIYFRGGAPAKVRSTIKGAGLGTVLEDLDMITGEQLRACQQEMARTGLLAGEILVDQGVLEAPDQVRGLREQMRRKLVDVFGLTEARWEFYEKVNLIAGYGADELFPIDPLPVIAAGLRAHAGELKLRPVLASLGGKWISLEDVEAVRRFDFDKEGRDICRRLLEKQLSWDALVESGRFDLDVLRATVYALLITKALAVSEQGRPDPRIEGAGTLQSYVPGPPEKVETDDPEILSQRERIQEATAAIGSQNYYEMLGLSPKASTEEVRKAFFKLARELHPDRCNKPGLEDLRETLEHVFFNLSEAQATLIDPDLREEYDRVLGESGRRTSTPPGSRDSRDEEEVRDVLEAEKLFQKALVLLRRTQRDQALELVDRARELNPEQGEYLALWAHLGTLRRGPDESLEDLVAELRRARELAPNSERVHLYLAQALKRIDHLAEARSHLEKVVEINPRNIEAMRELRIMEMRREKQKTQKGFFKKLLG